MSKSTAAIASLAVLAACSGGGGGDLIGKASSASSALHSPATARAGSVLQLTAGSRTVRFGNTIIVVPSRGTNYAPNAAHPRAGAKISVVRRPYRQSSGQYLWAGDFTNNTIWQTKANFSINKTGKKIVGELTDCSAPDGLKVDHQGDLWAVCEGTGTVNMYPPGATVASVVLKSTYTSGSLSVYSEPLDVTFDSLGTVYVSNAFVYETQGSKQLAYAVGGIQVFPADCGGHPCDGDTPAALIKDPNQNPKCPRTAHECITQSAGGFLDTDNNGSIYEAYSTIFYVCVSNSSCNQTYSQFGVDQIKNPQRPRPKFTNVVMDSSTFEPGGVYTTAAGTVLNVLDQSTHIVSQYAIPTFAEIGTLGPMQGSPCGQAFVAFNPTEKQLSSGDYGCAGVNVGNVATNSFVLNKNPSYNTIVGVAYDPSDK